MPAEQPTSASSGRGVMAASVGCCWGRWARRRCAMRTAPCSWCGRLPT